MGRNLSPALSQELANLEKDADSRRSAMKALKHYVKDLDSKAIPMFLAKVSASKDAGSSNGEYTISLFEVLARVHGPKIVSQLDNIMSTIIKTLATSKGSFHLQQACSKVVPAIARYGIEPTTPEEKKRQIIHLLCKPLSDSLLSSQESLSCGAALCLKALVDCDNWRFASDEMVNEVCLKLASALKDTSTLTNSHMGLVMPLAKRNSFVVEAYARLLVKAGLHILNCGLGEKNSQKRLTAIKMIHSLMKFLDIRSIISELEVIIKEMEKCQFDQMPYVKGAAFEALQTAKRLLAEKASKCTDSDVVSVTGSNYSRSCNGRRRYLSTSGSQSPLSGPASPLSDSPESQTLDSFVEYDSLMDSSSAMSQASCNGNHITKNVNRKLWKENVCVDISLNDELFSELAREGLRSYVSSEHDEQSNSRKSYANGFPGFVQGSPVNRGLRNQSPSPQRSSQINVDSIKIFTTPRKLVKSLQDNVETSDCCVNQTRWRRSPSPARYGWSPVPTYDENDHFNKDRLKGAVNDECEAPRSDTDSVSSTENVLTNTQDDSNASIRGDSIRSPKLVKSSRWRMVGHVFLYFVLVFLAALGSVLWFIDQDGDHHLVPT